MHPCFCKSAYGRWIQGRPPWRVVTTIPINKKRESGKWRRSPPLPPFHQTAFHTSLSLLPAAHVALKLRNRCCYPQSRLMVPITITFVLGTFAREHSQENIRNKKSLSVGVICGESALSKPTSQRCVSYVRSRHHDKGTMGNGKDDASDRSHLSSTRRPSNRCRISGLSCPCWDDIHCT